MIKETKWVGTWESAACADAQDRCVRPVWGGWPGSGGTLSQACVKAGPAPCVLPSPLGLGHSSLLSGVAWPLCPDCKQGSSSGRKLRCSTALRLAAFTSVPGVTACGPSLSSFSSFFSKVCFFSETHTEGGEPHIAFTPLTYSSLFYDFVLKTIGIGYNNTDVFASQENREFPLLSSR